MYMTNPYTTTVGIMEDLAISRSDFKKSPDRLLVRHMIFRITQRGGFASSTDIRSIIHHGLTLEGYYRDAHHFVGMTRTRDDFNTVLPGRFTVYVCLSGGVFRFEVWTPSDGDETTHHIRMIYPDGTHRVVQGYQYLINWVDRVFDQPEYTPPRRRQSFRWLSWLGAINR
jgi:hypothetical protein